MGTTTDLMQHAPAVAPITLRLTGQFGATVSGKVLELPPSRKARALLGYLAATRRPQRREHLVDLLWGGSDEGRVGLRWCLSRLRKSLEWNGKTPILTNRDTAELDADLLYCDIWTIQDIGKFSPSQASTSQLIQAADVIGGDFMEGLDMPDIMEFRLWCMAERENLRRLHVAVLEQLGDRLGQTGEALPYARKRVLLEPENESTHITLLDLLISLDRRAEAEAHVEATRRQFDMTALPPPYRLTRRWAAAARPEPELPNRDNPEPERQRVYYCTSGDGVRIAYSITGAEAGVPIITTDWPSHLELDCTGPIWRRMISVLSDGRRLIRYNQRGSGLSDWSIPSYTFDDHLSDLKAVADTAGGAVFDLVGICRGCADSIAFAVRYPERVRRLVLIGGSPAGWSYGTPERRESGSALAELIRQYWGSDNPAIRQIFTTTMFPDMRPEQAQWFDDLQRISSSPENAALWVDLLGDYDVTDLLSQVHCPTLVLHSREDAMAPLEMGRDLARQIPAAQFVTLPSRNHVLLEDDPAWDILERELTAFLAN